MLIVISPAKTLDFKLAGPADTNSLPEFGKEAANIARILQKMSPSDLGRLMSISPKLAYENYDRYQRWSLTAGLPDAKQAILAYKGDVYNGLHAAELTKDELFWAQDHLRILSGLYGILRPLDLIMPYRLEFATKLKVKQYNSLYEYWKKYLTRSLASLKKEEGSGILINLASAEYFMALDRGVVGFRIITPIFKEYRSGELKFLSMFGKQARGMMTRYIIRNGIKDPEQLKLFGEEGYAFSAPLSDDSKWVFTR